MINVYNHSLLFCVSFYNHTHFVAQEVAFGQKGEVSQEESHMVPDISEDCQVVPDIYVA